MFTEGSLLVSKRRSKDEDPGPVCSAETLKCLSGEGSHLCSSKGLQVVDRQPVAP